MVARKWQHKEKRAWPRRAGFVLLLLALLPGCSELAAIDWFPNVVSTREVRFEISPLANQNSAMRVDLVAVYTDPMLEQLLTLPATEWFDKKGQFRRDYPDGFEVFEWELTPGQILPPTEMSDKVGLARGAVVYADYSTKGDHRARVGRLSVVRIHLEEEDFWVETVDE